MGPKIDVLHPGLGHDLCHLVLYPIEGIHCLKTPHMLAQRRRTLTLRHPVYISRLLAFILTNALLIFDNLN